MFRDYGPVEYMYIHMAWLMPFIVCTLLKIVIVQTYSFNFSTDEQNIKQYNKQKQKTKELPSQILIAYFSIDLPSPKAPCMLPAGFSCRLR